jgi:predicted aspartyl protease
MRSTILVVLAGVAAAAGAQPLTTQLQPGEIPKASAPISQNDDLKLGDDRARRMTVPVLVAGAGPFQFLVDTGADHSAVSSNLVEQLRLPLREPARLHSPTGVSLVATASVPQLTVGQRTMPIDRAAVLDATHMGADGILGTDSLRTQRVTFDFKTGTMSLLPAVPDPADKAGEALVVKGRLKSGRLVFTNAVAESTKATVVVDTGSQVTIGNPALRRQLLGGHAPREDGLVRVRSVTGASLNAEAVVLRRLELGAVTLQNFEILFADAHTFRQLGLSSKPALLLGMDAMRAFDRVSIDFRSKKLHLSLPEVSDAEPATVAAR